MNTMQEKIKQLYHGTIQDFNLSIPTHRLSFQLRKNVKGKEELFEVMISQMAFYVFYDKAEDQPQEYRWDNTLLVRFVYGAKLVQSHERLANTYMDGKKFNIDYNLFLEFASADLLLQANRLQINDDVFELE